MAGTERVGGKFVPRKREHLDPDHPIQTGAQERTAPRRNGGDDWQEVAIERPKYSPETCGETPLQGYLLSLVELPLPQGRVGTWWAFVVKLTAPCFAADPFDKDAAPVRREIGTEVLLPKSAKLSDLARFLHPDHLVEVRVQPVEKVSIGNGRTMWRWKVAANRSSLQPRGIYAREIKLLGAAPSGGEQTRDEDVPF